MLRAELLEIIRNGGNSGVEFKRDDVRPEQIAKEIVALANFQGGRILLGVEDDGRIAGIQRPDLETWLMDAVFGRFVHPLILPFYEEVEIETGRRVAVVTLLPGMAKPYVVRHNDREDIYVRVGSTSRLATREQQARLFQSGGLLHTELLPVSGTGLGELDEARLSDYLVNLLGEAQAPTTPEAWTERLLGLGFLVEREGTVASTIAGLVLFGRRPRRALRHAGIRWMSFAGTEMGYRARDDFLLDGPLVSLGAGAADRRTIVEGGLLERLAERMRPFISEEAMGVGEDFRRERLYRYPLDAIREGVLNALVHRDWTRGLEVEIVDFADRMELKSPGALPNSMTLEKMFAGQRSPRNPLLVDVMRDYGYVDARGMGVRRKILPLTRELSGEEARFHLQDDALTVTLPARRLPEDPVRWKHDAQTPRR